MSESQKATYAVAIAPTAILDDTAAAMTAIDTAGTNYAEIVVQLGATDIGVTVLKMTECDTSGGTYTDITGADFDGGLNTEGTALALPSATDDGQTCVFQVNLDATKRYLKCNVTFGNGTAGGFVAAVARLSCVDLIPTADASLADGGVCRV